MSVRYVDAVFGRIRLLASVSNQLVIHVSRFCICVGRSPHVSSWRLSSPSLRATTALSFELRAPERTPATGVHVQPHDYNAGKPGTHNQTTPSDSPTREAQPLHSPQSAPQHDADSDLTI